MPICDCSNYFQKVFFALSFVQIILQLQKKYRIWYGTNKNNNDCNKRKRAILLFTTNNITIATIYYYYTTINATYKLIMRR